MDVAVIREGSGLSQASLAERVGVSRSLVAMWERGEREPSVEQRVALAALLPGVSSGQVHLAPYPSAPLGGRPGSAQAQVRRVFFARRNARIQKNDPDVAEVRVLQDIVDTADRRAKIVAAQ